MKREIIKTVVKAALAGIFGLGIISASSCDMLGPADKETPGEGQLRIAFASPQAYQSKASSEIPDTSDFILTVTGPEGNILYDGKYGDCPESIIVKEGSYTVSAVSEAFTKPAFSKPQYGDRQCVVVPPGGVANVRLTCRQTNCGVRLDVDSDFLTACPDGVLFLKSEQGRLMYGYSEKRIAYFHPGMVSLVLSQGGKDELLMSRELQAQQILVLGVNVSASISSSQKESISVVVDTSRVWLSEQFVIGGEGGGGGDDALTVNQTMSSVGQEDVWVSGYVVGGDLTSSSASFEEPFTSRTCLLLGPRSSTTSRSSCISVQLPSGELRNALNLVDNPELLGKKILVRGDVVSSYYGLVGLKNCTDYKL